MEIIVEGLEAKWFKVLVNRETNRTVFHSPLNIRFEYSTLLRSVSHALFRNTFDIYKLYAFRGSLKWILTYLRCRKY